MCDLEVMGVPSILSIIRKTSVLTRELLKVFYESRKGEPKTRPIYECRFRKLFIKKRFIMNQERERTKDKTYT